MKHIQGLTFHALLSKESSGDHNFWVAQGLEYDIVAQAPTKAELHRRFCQTVASHIIASVEKGEEPLASLKRLGEAPPEFWKAYLKSSKNEMPVSLPPRRGASGRFDLSKIPATRLLVKQAQCA